jgi:hypothetical protein
MQIINLFLVHLPSFLLLFSLLKFKYSPYILLSNTQILYFKLRVRNRLSFSHKTTVMLYTDTQSHVTRNPPTGMRRLFRVESNSFPTAAATSCHGRFRVKLDSVFQSLHFYTGENKINDYALNGRKFSLNLICT